MTLRVLAITNLFPNAVDPLWGPFNRQQYVELNRLCSVEVLATIPWFPGSMFASRYSAAGRLGRVPYREVIDGIPVRHPRTLYVPKVPALSAPLYSASLLAEAVRLRGNVDVVLGSFGYPDGCAAVAVAGLIGAPSVVMLLGSDINRIGLMTGPRAILRAMLPRAQAVAVVSRSLGEKAVALGVSPERVALVHNGVNTTRFFPRDRLAARAQLGIPLQGKLILYVGALKETKGVLDLAEAFSSVAASRPDISLVMLGSGDDRSRCERFAQRIGPQMSLPGPMAPDEVATWMASCDVMTLPSWGEGTPNVILEALASGRRVVATDVGGIPDLITSGALGALVSARQPAALAEALVRAADVDYDAEQVAKLGAHGDWALSAAALHEVLVAAVADG